MEQENQSILNQGLDHQTSQLLNTSASWGRMLGIVGFIMSALMIAMGVMMFRTPGNLAGAGIDQSQMPAGAMRMAGTMGLIIYVFMGILFGIGSKFIYYFGVKTSEALRSGNTNNLHKGLSGLKNYMAFWTILMIISVLFSLIGVVGMAMMPR